MTGVPPLHSFLQHVLDVPTGAATLLVPTYPIAWPLDPPSQPLCVLANALSHWMRTHNPQHTFLTYSDVERLRRLCALPTSVLTPLFHALATALQSPSVASVYPAHTALRHRFASLGDTRGWAAPRWSVATPRVDHRTDVWARVPNAGSVEVNVSVAGESPPSRATLVPIARDAVAREAAMASLLRRPSLKQRVARHVATAVRSLKASCARATQRLLEAGPAHDVPTGTDTNRTLPPVIPLADVVDRVCMQTMTSRTHPVVLRWTRRAMTAAGTAETEDVRLIRYTPGAVDTQGRPTECRIRRLAKTGSSAYKSVSVRTLAFPSGRTPPVPNSGQWAPAEDKTASITRKARPAENRYGVLPRPALVDTTTPIVPPPRADVAPALAALVDLPMRTDAPLQTPHHVGRLYVQMGTAGVTPVGVYTESRLDDGTTLRMYTFEADPKRVYTHRSRRRTDGVRV